MSKDLPEGLAYKEDLNLYRYCNGNLNFSTASHDDEDYGYQKKKIVRDPMSHRIIEKRRRDRMNNCLADLSRLIPPDYLKKGRGRIEKTEIIEMAIKHMRHLQSVISSSRMNVDSRCDNSSIDSPPDQSVNRDYEFPASAVHQPIIAEHYRLGYLECLSEAMHFLVEVQGYFAGDSLCVQMINHLHKHCDKILKSDLLNRPRKHTGETASSNSSGSPTNANYVNNNSPPLGLSVSNGSNSDDNQPSSYEAVEDPARYSDLSKKSSDVAYYHHRYSELENERISENPSDSDPEQNYSVRVKDSVGASFVPLCEDPGKSDEFTPGTYSSSSGIGSNPEQESYGETVLVKEESGGSSQLRSMLTSPKVMHQDGKRNVSPSHSLSVQFHAGDDRQSSEATKRDIVLVAPTSVDAAIDCRSYTAASSDAHGNLYKFKNNIKQRFSKERRDRSSDEEEYRGGDPLTIERLNLMRKKDEAEEYKRKRSHQRIRSDADEPENKMKKWREDLPRVDGAISPGPGGHRSQYYEETGRKPVDFLGVTEYLSSEQRLIHKLDMGKGRAEADASVPALPVRVPIFALHSNGSFYVPLTMDQSSLSPFLSALGFTKSEEGEEKTVLHPVTISVNFTAAAYLPRDANNASNPPWK